MKTEKKVTGTLKQDVCKNTNKNNQSCINEVEDDIHIFNIQKQPKTKIQLRYFIAVAFIALLSPQLTFAQLPNLGTAIDFSVFTSVGALGNTGTSDITGDIGTNNGAVSGFDAPTIVTGTIEEANGVTAQCLLDVQSAYNEIFAIAPTDVAHAPAFGGGETLTEGVYFIGAAGSIGGNLTLDAEGNPDALFIFQFGGAFTTGASSTVNLINGATACHVFWIAEGAMSMAALTDMKGSLISNNGAVSMGAGATLEGRMLTTAGAASVYDALINLPTCIISVLPIKLLSFTGYCENKNIVLQWNTKTETNNDYFTIERSADAINWNTVETVTGAGNSSCLLNYSLTDKTNNDLKKYYRLKQTDFNGKFTYEDIICIKNCEENTTHDFTIYPNPSEGKFELQFNGDASEIIAISIFNSKGKNIYNALNYEPNFDLSNYESGFYFIQIQKKSEIVNLKVMLNN